MLIFHTGSTIRLQSANHLNKDYGILTVTSQFVYPVRVYYEDTDAGGVVYHARYLHFLERARTEYLRQLSFSQERLLSEEKFAFVVRKVMIDYLVPAKLDDWLQVETAIVEMKNASLLFEQILKRDEQVLCKATVKVACVDLSKMKPIVIPQKIKNAFIHHQYFRSNK